MLAKIEAACLWLTQRRQGAEKSIPHFRRAQSLMSQEQRAFYVTLVQAVGPEPLIFPHVNLSQLVKHPGNEPQYQFHWRRVRRRWLDFVICSDLTIYPVLAIKLETPTEKRKRRLGGIDVLGDALTSARIPLLRLPLADHHDASELMERIRWVLVGEKYKTDRELFETEEIQDPSIVVDFARKQLPTFVRWTVGLNRHFRAATRNLNT